MHYAAKPKTLLFTLMSLRLRQRQKKKRQLLTA